MFQKNYDEGSNLLATGECDLAREKFELCLADEPEDGATLHKLGCCFEGLKNWQGALDAFERAAKNVPHERSYLCLKGAGSSLVQLGRYSEAIDCFSKALAICQTYHKARCDRAIAYAGTGQYALAIADLVEAERSGHKLRVTDYNRLAVYYAKIDKFDEAYSACSRALRIDSSDAPAKKNLSLIDEMRRDVSTLATMANVEKMEMPITDEKTCEWCGNRYFRDRSTAFYKKGLFCSRKCEVEYELHH